MQAIAREWFKLFFSVDYQTCLASSASQASMAIPSLAENPRGTTPPPPQKDGRMEATLNTYTCA
jgi:hypothetical protein